MKHKITKTYNNKGIVSKVANFEFVLQFDCKFWLIFSESAFNIIKNPWIK